MMSASKTQNGDRNLIYPGRPLFLTANIYPFNWIIIKLKGFKLPFLKFTLYKVWARLPWGLAALVLLGLNYI